MKFPYFKQPSQLDPTRPWISRPVIPVRLWHKAVALDVYALVDSGADISLFSAAAARELLLDLESGEHQEFVGISGHAIDVYYHTINVQLIGSPERHNVTVGFSAGASQSVLGQADFFMHYAVKFERYKERIDINPARK